MGRLIAEAAIADQHEDRHVPVANLIPRDAPHRTAELPTMHVLTVVGRVCRNAALGDKFINRVLGGAFPNAEDGGRRVTSAAGLVRLA
jgi:hypothetical protein